VRGAQEGHRRANDVLRIALAVGVRSDKAAEPREMSKKVIDASLQCAAFAEVHRMAEQMHMFHGRNRIEDSPAS
jgi:hypothetical protein